MIRLLSVIVIVIITGLSGVDCLLRSLFRDGATFSSTFFFFFGARAWSIGGLIDRLKEDTLIWCF